MQSLLANDFLVLTVLVFVAIMLLLGGAGTAWATNGHFLHAVGAVDSAMGGVGTAAPLDAVGMIFNNVGSASDIPGQRVDFSFASGTNSLVGRWYRNRY